MGDEVGPRRSLILAGGGSKVAFQAGVLQVWLDEAAQTFDHIDAASGGVLNLAMLCQGMTGTEVADNWRAYRPPRAPSTPMSGSGWCCRSPSRVPVRAIPAERARRVGPRLERVRSSALEATFNLYDFTRQEHEIVEPARHHRGQAHLGRIASDVVPAGVGRRQRLHRRRVRHRWQSRRSHSSRRRRDLGDLDRQPARSLGRGLVAQYFQMIEAMANGQLNAILARIERSNERGERGARRVRPSHRGADPTKRGAPALLAQLHARPRAGRGRTRCASGPPLVLDEGIAVDAPPGGQPSRNRHGIRFREVMSGGWPSARSVRGRCRTRSHRANPMQRAAGDRHRRPRSVHRHADHQAVARGRRVGCLRWRTRRRAGDLQLVRRPRRSVDKRMLYRLWFRDTAGHPLTLDGHKVVQNDPGPDLWRDTTTLFAVVLSGHVDSGCRQRGQGGHRGQRHPPYRSVPVRGGSSRRFASTRRRVSRSCRRWPDSVGCSREHSGTCTGARCSTTTTDEIGQGPRPRIELAARFEKAAIVSDGFGPTGPGIAEPSTT